MVRVIKHSNIDQNTLQEIVKIKQLSWDYSMEQHLLWINDNLKDNDYHFLLFDNEELIAYMNLVEVNVDSNSTSIPFLGIGNVCSKYKGRGDGKKLMIEVNAFIKENSFYGILFCKNHLVDFYKKFDWKLIQNLYPNDTVFTMMFNYNGDSSNFVYNDRLF